jgi:hypothetical protein
VLIVKHPDYLVGESERRVSTDAQGRKILHNDYLRLKPDAPEGLGTRIFAHQVKAAVAANFARIETFAAGSASTPRWNGYYTWPRLGYDAALTPAETESLPADLSQATTVLDLMATEPGRAWWKQHGSERKMVFDLTPGSRSLGMLGQYLQDKNIRP